MLGPIEIDISTRISTDDKDIAIKKAKKASLVSYQPHIPESGSYAVYVSYATMENSADDVTYTVWHKGQETHFKVNQRFCCCR